MSCRLVPNSLTLDDLERRNSPNRSLNSPNYVAFGADYVKVVEDTVTGGESNTRGLGPRSSRSSNGSDWSTRGRLLIGRARGIIEKS